MSTEEPSTLVDTNPADPMANWLATARPEQLPPTDPNWQTWLIIAGAGWGKTRSASEWIRSEVYAGKRRLPTLKTNGVDRGSFVFPCGAEFWLYPAYDPHRLPPMDCIWAENPSYWPEPRALKMRQICEAAPRVVVTSRPKAGLDIASLIPAGRPIAFSTGGMLDNAANLDPAFVQSLRAELP